jgi:regulatory subunit for Cdc7p protein kinase
MSTRRTPLTNNPNVVNSPLRTAASLAQAKQKRSYATVQREDIYGQPPPLKKQTLEAFPQRPPRSPSKSSRASGLPQRTARPVVRERSAPQQQVQHENAERIRQWQVEYQSRFPKMVFYFESISEEVRAKLSKQAISLGAVSNLHACPGPVAPLTPYPTERGTLLLQRHHPRRHHPADPHR